MYMFKYIMKRLGFVIFSFVVIMTTCFFLIKMLPIPINVTIGQSAEDIKNRLIARGYYDDITMAAAAGSFVCGEAACLAEKENGSYSMVASDTVSKLPEAIMNIQK